MFGNRENRLLDVRAPLVRHGEGPRPCYHMLRLLGMWQPRSSHIACKIYNIFMVLVWCYTVAMIILLSRMTNTGKLSHNTTVLDYRLRVSSNNPNNSSFNVLSFLNSTGTFLNFCIPFWFLRYYFYYGNFNRLMRYVYHISDSEGRGKMQRLKVIYTVVSLIFWVLFSAFYICHWEGYFTNNIIPSYNATAGFYCSVAVLTMGWWSVWVCMYGYVCHTHTYQIAMFRKSMRRQLHEASGDAEHEELVIGSLLHEFCELTQWLEQTKRDFNKIISFAVAYHIYDLFVFSYAYWTGALGYKHHTLTGLLQYIGTAIYDTISISIKLYPAGILSRAMEKIVNTASNLILIDDDATKLPFKRMLFYKHIVMRIEDIGFQILGVKITLKLIIGIFVSVGTALVTFLLFVLRKNY